MIDTTTTRTGGSCAMVLSNAVGDSVMMMALAHNLVRNGRRVQVHGRIGEQLAAWYPWAELAPPSALESRYDCVFGLYAFDLGKSLGRDVQSVAVASLPGFRQAGDLMLDRIVQAARHFGVAEPARASGIVIPEAVLRQRDPRRIVIHPTASHPEKTWRAAGFVQLAGVLTRRGFRPSFIVPPQDLDRWREVETTSGIPVFAFPTLGDVASWIATAGWFIGNDSGVMHLAAAAGAPTLGLFGPSDERLYAPWGARAQALRGAKPFETYRAADPGLNQAVNHMRDLHVDRVKRAARELAARTG